MKHGLIKNTGFSFVSLLATLSNSVQTRKIDIKRVFAMTTLLYHDAGEPVGVNVIATATPATVLTTCKKGDVILLSNGRLRVKRGVKGKKNIEFTYIFLDKSSHVEIINSLKTDTKGNLKMKEPLLEPLSEPHSPWDIFENAKKENWNV